MRAVAAGLAEVFFIDLQNSRVVVALAEGFRLVLAVKRRGAHCPEIGEVPNARGLDRLSAAVDAASGAAHDLNEMIVRFARLDFVEQRLDRKSVV